MPGDRPRSPRDDRLSLGRAAVVTFNRAAALLPIRDAEARAWLRRNELIRHIEGRAVVRWGDVLDQLDETPLETPPNTPARPPLRRVSLAPKT